MFDQAKVKWQWVYKVQLNKEKSYWMVPFSFDETFLSTFNKGHQNEEQKTMSYQKEGHWITNFFRRSKRKRELTIIAIIWLHPAHQLAEAKKELNSLKR